MREEIEITVECQFCGHIFKAWVPVEMLDEDNVYCPECGSDLLDEVVPEPAVFRHADLRALGLAACRYA